MGSGGAGETSKMVAISYGSQVRLWGISDEGAKTNIGEIVKLTFFNDCFRAST